MTFTTPEFVLFFALWFPVTLVTRGRLRKLVLLVGSYLFYAAADPRFVALLAASTALDFVVARAMSSADAGRRRRLLGVSVVGNLGVLGVFKYYDFFVREVAAGLARFGWDVEPRLLGVVVPAGISFYTFQTLAYTVDVYRGRLRATDSWLDFAVFVAFLPQLVAGPIERAEALLPQIGRSGTPRALPGGWLFLAKGAFKKVVIADSIAPVVDAAYADPTQTSAVGLWLATYLFAVQLYCDFSGYSDLAVGLGRLLGVELSMNFRAPYAARGPRDFWRRWHVTLSSWLRDYLYIPLGGNRTKTERNLVLTMVLGGLWHGAAWNFVLWGLYHGSCLLLGRFLGRFAAQRWRRSSRSAVDGVSRHPWPARVVATLERAAFLQVTCVGWALFRAESLTDCQVVLSKLLNPWRWDLGAWYGQVAASGQGRYVLMLCAIVAVVVGSQWCWPEGTEGIMKRVAAWPWGVRLVLVVALFGVTMVLAPEAPPPFLYFQF